MRKCKVYVNGIEAGILTEFDFPRNYQFKYHEEYLKSKLPGVSLSMTLQDKEYHSPVQFPYFFNLLSEGENRAMQASIHHIDKDDDFGILLATARYDTVGAVTVEPIYD